MPGTWLTDLPAGDTDWDRVRQLFPSSFDAFADVQRAAWMLFDPVTLELCRLRKEDGRQLISYTRVADGAAIDAEPPAK